VKDLRWHDLRHEYASRLVERGVPLSQVRDLLGHASIVTTERYDNQRPEPLFEAAARLESVAGVSRIFQESKSAVPESTPADRPVEDGKLLSDQEIEDGVSDGDRTRDSRIHNPELYH